MIFWKKFLNMLSIWNISGLSYVKLWCQPMRDSLPSTSRSLPIALMRARERVMSPIREMLAKSEITEQQWRILRALSEYGEMDSTSLASRSALLTPSLTRIINSMLSKGLVTQRRDAQDKRRQRIDITTKGQMIIDDNLAEATSIMQTVKQTLGTDNYEKLLDLLNLLEGSASNQQDLDRQTN